MLVFGEVSSALNEQHIEFEGRTSILEVRADQNDERIETANGWVGEIEGQVTELKSRTDSLESRTLQAESRLEALDSLSLIHI